MTLSDEQSALVNGILEKCHKANSLVYGTEEHRQVSDSMWKAILCLSTPANSISLSILQGKAYPGRHITFAVSDGYAHYIISCVSTKHCKLIHIPYGDAYKSPLVDKKGNADMRDVEKILEFDDLLNAAYFKLISKLPKV